MASTYMNRTLTANNQKKLTISVWVKIAKVQEQMIVSSYSSGSLWGSLYFAGTGQLRFYDYRGSYILQLDSNALYRDTNAWMHIVANFDCSIGSPTAKLYVNGEEVSYATQTIYSQNATTSWNTDYDFQIGKGSDLGGNQFDGQMSDLYFIQGYTYDASTFGETDSTSGIWKPKTNPTINYGGTGGNSCHLKFENSGNMDLDSGDNNVSLTTSGTLTQNVDTPSNNFATFNPLKDGRMNGSTQYKATFTNGNTTSTFAESTYNTSAFSSLAVNSGKYYAEIKCSNAGGNTKLGLFSADDYGSNDFSGTYLYDSSGTFGGSSYGNSFTTGDIIQIAFDATNGTVWFGKNGTWQDSATQSEIEAGTTTNSASTGIDMTQFWHFGTYGVNATAFQANFGQGYFGTTAVASAGTAPSEGGIFEYDCPSGFQALCTKGINSF